MHTLAGRVSPLLAFCLIAFAPSSFSARDDGRYGASPLKQWFDQLTSGMGLCCSFADGVPVVDVDWETQGGSYRVRIHGEWITVPDSALVTVPNRFGSAVIWTFQDASGGTHIRCFMPGAGS